MGHATRLIAEQQPILWPHFPAWWRRGIGVPPTGVPSVGSTGGFCFFAGLAPRARWGIDREYPETKLEVI